MNYHQSRKKALSRKRDQMIGLFTDAKINRMGGPKKFGDFYDYVTDLDAETTLDEPVNVASQKQALVVQAKVIEDDVPTVAQSPETPIAVAPAPVEALQENVEPEETLIEAVAVEDEVTEAPELELFVPEEEDLAEEVEPEPNKPTEKSSTGFWDSYSDH